MSDAPACGRPSWREAADADADATLVRLLQQAARDWGAWYEADARARIARDGVTLARFRLDAVRSRVREGDVAALDSVEALAEWDRRLLAEIDASAALASARLVVSGHLWDANGAAVALPPTARPRLGAASVADGARRVDEAQLVRLAREHPLGPSPRGRAGCRPRRSGAWC
jgi:outer membrane protein TolC